MAAFCGREGDFLKLNICAKDANSVNGTYLSPVSCYFMFLSLILLFTAVPGCSAEKGKPEVPRQSSKDAAADTSALATIAEGDLPEKMIAAHMGPESQGEAGAYRGVFNASGTGVAYVANMGSKVQLVYNRSRGNEYSSVGTIVFSPDGRRIAYPAVGADGTWRMVVDGKEGRPYATLLTPIFSPDSRHVAYQAKEGDKWYIVVDDTRNQGTIASYTAPEFSSDSALIAYVEAAASNKDMRLFVSDLKFNNLKVTWSIGDLLFKTSKNGTRLAAAQVAGSRQKIVDFYFAKPDVVHEGREYDLVDKLALSDDGKSVAYCVLKGQKRLVVLDGKEEPLPDGRMRELPVIRPDRRGVGLLFVTIDGRFFLHQSFVNSHDMGKMYDEAVSLTYSKHGDYAYAARKGNSWFVVVNGKEGAGFDRVISPQFSPSGNHLAYRARKGGRQFVIIADRSGKTIRQHPAYDQVFDVTYTADGKSIAYGVLDGKRLVWKVEKLY